MTEKVPNKINYVGMTWSLVVVVKMFDEYEDFEMYVYYPASDEKKYIDVEYEAFKFSQLSKDIHICFEEVSNNPEGKLDFHSLAIAKRKGTKWPEKLPEWKQKY